jgi:P4 family phage/plasmid primase-like protien
MEQFIGLNKFKFISTKTKFQTNSEGEETKTYLPALKGWKDKTYEELVEINNNLNNDNTTYLINCNNDFLIFDTDYKDDYERLVSILKENNLYEEEAITESSRGKTYPYKRHFWFKVEDREFKTMKKHYFNNLEIFIGSNCSIAENSITIINNVPTLSFDDYEEIKMVFEVVDKKTIMRDNKEENIIKVSKTNSNTTHQDKNLLTILDGLKAKRFQNYQFWMSIYWVFLNEKLDLEIFKSYSKKHYKKYNEEENEKIFSSSAPQNGYKIATLYHYLKEDNYEVFKSLQSSRIDFWAMFDNIKSHSDLAKLYYSLNPTKYIYHAIQGWFEYNKSNILMIKGKDFPSSMLNSITNTFQELLIEQRNLTLPIDKDLTEYKNKMKIFQNAYNKVGTSTFIKGVMEYLRELYNMNDIETLIDNNVNLIAFNNMLYDNSIKDFRPIKPNDYITKTTKYDINRKSNPILRNKLIALIRSMFETDDIYNYHLQTIANSLFGNKNEVFVINSGKGRNGKGVCSTLIENALGSYFYAGESTFLTTVYKADRPNSTLYNLRGVRYFLTTEPEADNETKFNIGLIKKITGNDTITTRDLNKGNISYIPHFTPFLQCNTKPKIDNIDDAIKNRFRILNFPFAFVQNPTKKNEKQGDITLKESLNQEMYNEFMLLLLDISKNPDSKIPASVLSEVDEYLNSNNYVKSWLETRYMINDNRKDIQRASILLQEYNNSGDYPQLSNVKFTELMKMNNIQSRLLKGNKYYYGLSPLDDIENDL